MISRPLRRRALLLASAALLLGAPAGLGGAPASAAGGGGALVGYAEEGGLGGPRASLAVSAHRHVTVTLAGGRTSSAPRTVRFRLDPTTWSALRSALKRADLNALAKRPATRPYPDAITYVITAGHETIRASDGAIPRKLQPLLGIMRRIVKLGEQRATHAG